jgi:predicted MFS family arabinose efflux permease
MEAAMDRRLVALSIGMFAMGTDNFVVAGILPSVAASLDVSVSVAGQMVTIYALSFALLAPVMAVATGAWPRKVLLVSALGVFVAGNAVNALASNIELVLASRAIAGLGAAMFAPTALGVAATITSAESRGRALAAVSVGLAGATALGAPIGAFIGGLGSWRSTLWFVSALGAIAMVLVWTGLGVLARPSRVTLRERIAPLRDLRVALTLLTTLLAFGGFLMVYTYAGLVFDRVTKGDGRSLAGLLLFWGVSAVIGNFWSGRLVDRFGSRVIINGSLLIGMANFVLLPWTSMHVASSVVALAVWGVVGWAPIVPQQHRLLKIAPAVGPLLLALNNTATYTGVAASALLGGGVIMLIDHHFLGLVGAALIALGLLAAEAAHALNRRREPSPEAAPHRLAHSPARPTALSGGS